MPTLTVREARARRHKRVRRAIHGTAERPRLVVFRSNLGIEAQLVDDVKGKTLTSASWIELRKTFKGTQWEKIRRPKTTQAREVGKLLTRKAQEHGIETVVFDRGGYLYHARVKALADAAREGGLKF
jgi:large subunit ribosomal protein L18